MVENSTNHFFQRVSETGFCYRVEPIHITSPGSMEVPETNVLGKRCVRRFNPDAPVSTGHFLLGTYNGTEEHHIENDRGICSVRAAHYVLKELGVCIPFDAYISLLESYGAILTNGVGEADILRSFRDLNVEHYEHQFVNTEEAKELLLQGNLLLAYMISAERTEDKLYTDHGEHAVVLKGLDSEREIFLIADPNYRFDAYGEYKLIGMHEGFFDDRWFTFETEVEPLLSGVFKTDVLVCRRYGIVIPYKKQRSEI